MMDAGSILASVLGRSNDRKSGKVDSVRLPSKTASTARAFRPSAVPTPAAEPAPLSVEAAANLRDSVITVLLECGRPMSFEDVFIKLKSSGADLPADKPKLIVRGIMANKKYFNTIAGLFTLKEGVLPMGNAPVPEPAPEEPPEQFPGQEVPEGEAVMLLDPAAVAMEERVATVREASAEAAQEAEAQATAESEIQPPVEEPDPPPSQSDDATAPRSTGPVRRTPTDPFINRLEAILGPGAGRMNTKKERR
jgi:hypothetical protein